MGKTAGDVVLERAEKLRERAKEDDWELHEWRVLVDDLRACPLSDATRAAWEIAVDAFPSAAAIWQRYAEVEIAAGNAAAVRRIFERSLLACPHADLWLLYIRFLKKVNEPRGAEGVAEVRAAFDFSVQQVGQDIHAGPLWQEYLNFLSGPKPGSVAYGALWTTGMVGGQEEAARAQELRRVFHSAFVVPTHAVEAIWKQYEAFELGQPNKQMAPRFIADQRPRFQAARMAHRERRRKLEGLDAAGWPLPPGAGGPQQEQQARLWRLYLDWERSNSQRLDAGALAARVAHAYRQALMPLRRFPEVWCEYARWHSEAGGGPAEAAAALRAGAAALPACLLLHFALADMHEAAGDGEAAQQVYESLVTQLEPPPDGAGRVQDAPEAARARGRARVSAAAAAAARAAVAARAALLLRAAV